MEDKQTLGQILKSAREQKNLELRDIAEKTKISMNILRYLEADDYKNLSYNIYLKGFVKNYAKEVGVDTELAKALLAKHFTPKEKNNKTAEKKKTNLSKKKSAPIDFKLDFSGIQKEIIEFIHKRINKKFIIITIIFFILFFTLKVIINWVADINSEQIETSYSEPIATEKVMEIKPSTSNILEMDATKKFALEIAKENETPKEVTKVVEEKKDEKKEEKKEVKSSKDDKKFPYKRFRQASNNIFTTDANASEMLNETLIAAGATKTESTEEQNVFIYAGTADSWLSYRVDDGKVTAYLLKKGRSLRLEGSRILLFIGNYGATDIFYNGVFVKSTSKYGVKSLIFPADKGSEYQLPLFPAHKGILYTAKYYQENMQEEVP